VFFVSAAAHSSDSILSQEEALIILVAVFSPPPGVHLYWTGVESRFIWASDRFPCLVRNPTLLGRWSTYYSSPSIYATSVTLTANCTD
jgi:hypothetical protein